MIKTLKALLILIIIFILVFFYIFYKTNFFKLQNTSNVVFLIERGDSVKKISNKLDALDIYTNTFVSYFTIRFLAKEINYGEYEIKTNQTIFSFIDTINKKNKYYRRLTFIEGDMASTYITQITNAYGLVGEINEKITEGYFMPGTYLYLYGESKDSIIKRARADMITFVQTEYDKVQNKEGFYLKNIHEVITLASIVEKESGVGVEQGLIAGVFYNRLNKKMRLQSDPTTIYELTKGKYKLERKLTRNDLKTEGLYNTYYIKGLPIGAIASPSKAAIIAVLNPEKTDNLFFVADGYGGHSFTPDYTEHKNNIVKYKEVLQNK